MLGSKKEKLIKFWTSLKTCMVYPQATIKFQYC